MFVPFFFIFSLALAIPQHILTIQHSPKFKSVNRFFKQNNPATNDSDFSILADIGLNSNYSWSELVDELTSLNKHHHHKQYKLFLLQRHGEGFHNIAPDLVANWTCQWQMQDGNDEMEWYDARLTEVGHEQITNLSKSIETEIERRQMPLPESFYVSPMRRTLETWDLTWSTITKQQPLIKEFARETYGIGTESKRHTKEYIGQNYPFAVFEAGFSQNDELWKSEVHESNQHRNYRAAQLLSDIFINDSNQIISIVSHSGLIKSILKVIGHRKWTLKTGQMIPVIIEVDYTKRGRDFNLRKPWGRLPEYCFAHSD
ncbi:hypothetical protein PICST_40227 [Scheffersomyces stipitis CBS 6054]|uniref:Phosphoglycerate mutase n=1 Tax=Scheffersomyces stipitis (strain ATCC 58785 / CBS 6054 / NBRC 10063 / NRRL Y-11545) TaxID=322104 RepID=A3GI87_PICST|nr:hypothetical protein PICST_40227 [Scheffersomyces stipitis CBS 6054]EAZ62945.2 hypothetical protein PICST_40227 [Scheffersomyces stipitis CBS 6054]